MEMTQNEPERVEEGSKNAARQTNLLESFSLIFRTGFGEIKRKGAITRLNFEIKSLERDKDKYIQALGERAWEAHIDHPDCSAIVTNLKELQIEINRLETQFGEHDTQIRDIEVAKNELTEKFNQKLDQIEESIVPHRKKIETINAEKEDNKKQVEDLRSKQDFLSQQVRLHQKNIQELDLGTDADAPSKIELEKGEIRSTFVEKCEIECKIPFLLSNLEKLKIALADETTEISRLEGEKEAAKRDYEHRMKDYNQEIHGLEEQKKAAIKKKESFRREMDPFLFDLGKRVDGLRPAAEPAFKENFTQLDDLNNQVQLRRKQITEAESLSRAMDRSAWLKFLVFSSSAVVLLIVALLILFH